MLTPEAARERLAQQSVPGLKDRRKQAVARLPRPQRDVGEGLLKSNRYGRSSVPPAAAQSFDNLSAKEREVLFSALFPSLSHHLEAWWQLGKRQPYQSGWLRRAFRAPHTPSLSIPGRLQRLTSLLWDLRDHDPDAEWLAHWAGYLMDGTGIGSLLAAVINRGGPEGQKVFEILVASAKGEEPIGRMGRHVTDALLGAKRPDGWEFVEQMLLAAERQEGLRQVIVESADVAHPEAFHRLLALILAQGMTRFSSVARAAGVWLGLEVEAGATRVLDGLLERALHFLEDPRARARAIKSGGGEDAYLALWALAYEDALEALSKAEDLLADRSPERRLAAVHLVAEVGIVSGYEQLVCSLGDDDLRVVRRVLTAFAAGNTDVEWSGLTDELTGLIARLGSNPKELEPLLWPWTGGPLTRAEVVKVLVAHSERDPIEGLAPYLPMMDAETRGIVARRLEKEAPRAVLRPLVLQLVGDTSSSVRASALKAAAKAPVSRKEAPALEDLLRRKAGDLRRGVEAMLCNQPDADVLASADRLLGGDAQQRLAGLELLRLLSEAGRAKAEVQKRTQAHAAAAPASKAEVRQVHAVLSEKAVEIANLDYRLGLVNDAELTAPAIPRDRSVRLTSVAATNALTSLDQSIHEQREQRVTVEMWDGPQEQLLGNLHTLRGPFDQWPPLRVPQDRPPLWEIWCAWDAQRSTQTRDSDGFELARAAALLLRDSKEYMPVAFQDHAAVARDRKGPTLRYPGIIGGVLAWLLALQPPSDVAVFLLDAAESSLCQVPEAELRQPVPKDDYSATGWRGRGRLAYLTLLRSLAARAPDQLSPEQTRRWWGLECWVCSPTVEVSSGLARLLRRRAAGGATHVGTKKRPPLEVIVAAYRAGAASAADLMDHLLDHPSGDRWSSRWRDLHRVSGRRPDRATRGADEGVSAIVAQIRSRVIEIELQRGEAPTPASPAALSLRYSGGLETLMPVLARLDSQPFVRGWSYDGESTTNVFSHLVRCSFPREEDTDERFAEAVRAHRIPEKRLVELAAFAPQWASRVQHAVGWPGLSSAVWWLHAHTKDQAWTVDTEIREAWAAEVAERTPLTGADLVDGAVDVEWFKAAHEQLGAKRWKVVDAAAKYCSTGGGHKRAQLFATAMLGQDDGEALRQNIAAKRHQDSVRALGLVPLPAGEDGRTEVIARYAALQAFLRESRQFGSQRQLSEKRAVEIGMANLARTAGYKDPLRLSWAVETETFADFANGRLTAVIDGVTLAVSVDEQGAPELSVTRDGKVLAAVPAKLRNAAEVKALRARVTDLRHQSSRVNASLEQAMIRGDAFTGDELHGLSRHPVLYPKLGRLVLLGDGIAGYAGGEGRTLIDHSGVEHAVGGEEELRVAHPLDLLEGGHWHDWQRDCLVRGIVQPFKQVFRELYVPTRDESGTVSRRYAGQQVQASQALALLGRRGWAVHPEEGVRKTFHQEHVIASVWFLDLTFTPGEVEAPTVEEVRFFSQDDSRPLEIADLPGRLFSEVMRDLDLVVSVAHAGGVDPESSTSTIEMRAALVKESAELLGVRNVRVEAPWVLIEGKLGDWSVHLGSAVVHRRPGGSVCIVPVHGQHRGRLFLPFADDDPKTAEVLAKVLLLARDYEIKDPTILEQLR